MCKRGTRIRKRISIHAPAKGATLCFLLLIVNKCHFNPRSREGSDQGAVAGSTIDVISIHAPAKGATRKSSGIKSRAFISIHAPAKGATESECTVAGNADISIHAPAKGATFSWVFIGFTAAQFQSTLPRRERQFFQYFHVLLFQFQSTLPRRERPFEISNKCCNVIFQSTLPRRERRKLRFYCPPPVEFQSTLPLRVRRLFLFLCCPVKQISIHAPAKGATFAVCSSIGSVTYFNPRSREGSDDRLTISKHTPFCISIHAPAKGATLLTWEIM